VKKDLKIPKLTLNRETLRNLETTELQTAIGGVASIPCTLRDYSCTHRNTCLC
jgi:hypothetical protein